MDIISFGLKMPYIYNIVVIVVSENVTVHYDFSSVNKISSVIDCNCSPNLVGFIDFNVADETCLVN